MCKFENDQQMMIQNDLTPVQQEASHYEQSPGLRPAQQVHNIRKANIAKIGPVREGTTQEFKINVGYYANR